MTDTTDQTPQPAPQAQKRNLEEVFEEHEKDRYKFNRVIQDFISSLESTNSIIKIVLNSVSESARQSGDEIANFIKTHGKIIRQEKKADTVTQEVRFSLELGKTAIAVLRKAANFSRAGKIMPRSFLVTMISHYDEFLGHLISTMLRIKPELLSASDQKFSLADISELNSIEDIRYLMIEQEVEMVLRRSHTAQFEWLEAKLGITLRKELKIWGEFVEITERRNLCAHTNAVVSRQYLNVCRQHGCEIAAKAGDVLEVSEAYLDRAFLVLFEIGVKLVQVVWRKLQPDDLLAAEHDLNEVCLELLSQDRAALAEPLLEFSVHTMKKKSNERMRLVSVINLANAYKQLGKEDDKRSLLKQEDWTAASQDFRLALAVLDTDYPTAAKIMKELGKAGIEKQHYLEWPIFKGFRESPEFLEAFEYLYGEKPGITTSAPTT